MSKKNRIKFDAYNPSHQKVITHLVDKTTQEFYPESCYKANKTCPNQNFETSLLPGEVYYQVYWKPGIPLVGFYLSNFGRLIQDFPGQGKGPRFIRWFFRKNRPNKPCVAIPTSSIPEDLFNEHKKVSVDIDLSRLVKYTFMDINDVLSESLRAMELSDETKAFLLGNCHVMTSVDLHPDKLSTIPVDNFKLVPASTSNLWSDGSLPVYSSDHIFDSKKNVMFELYQKYEINSKCSRQDMSFSPLIGEKWTHIMYKGEIVCGVIYSNYGRIIKYGNCLKAFLCKWDILNGYPKICIMHNGKQLNFFVHSLVASEVFMPLKANLPPALQGYPFTDEDLKFLRQFVIIDHIDDVRSNPKWNNLQFTTLEGNNKWRKLLKNKKKL